MFSLFLYPRTLKFSFIPLCNETFYLFSILFTLFFFCMVSKSLFIPFHLSVYFPSDLKKIYNFSHGFFFFIFQEKASRSLFPVYRVVIHNNGKLSFFNNIQKKMFIHGTFHYSHFSGKVSLPTIG